MNKRSILILLMVIGLTSCLKPTFYRRMNKAAIPTDIRNDKYILLVSAFNDKSLDAPNNKAVAKSMQDAYPGKFEVVHAGNEKDNKYNDKSVYKYFVTWSGTYSTTRAQPTGQIVNSHTSFVIHIVDRSTGKVSSLEEGLPTYLKALKYFGEWVAKNR